MKKGWSSNQHCQAPVSLFASRHILQRQKSDLKGQINIAAAISAVADQLQTPIWVNLDGNCALVAALQQNPGASTVCSFNLVLKPWERSLSK